MSFLKWVCWRCAAKSSWVTIKLKGLWQSQGLCCVFFFPLQSYKVKCSPELTGRKWGQLFNSQYSLVSWREMSHIADRQPPNAEVWFYKWGISSFTFHKSTVRRKTIKKMIFCRNESETLEGRKDSQIIIIHTLFSSEIFFIIHQQHILQLTTRHRLINRWI